MKYLRLTMTEINFGDQIKYKFYGFRLIFITGLIKGYKIKCFKLIYNSNHFDHRKYCINLTLQSIM